MNEKSNYRYQIAPPSPPPRRCRRTAIYIARSVFGGWFIFAGDNAWLHGERRAAVDDALWMSRNLGLPIVERLA